MFKLVRNKLVLIFLLFSILLCSVMDILKSILIGQFFDDVQLSKSMKSGIFVIFIFLILYLGVGMIKSLLKEFVKNKTRFSLNQDLYDHYLKKFCLSKSQSEFINMFNNKVEVVVEQDFSNQLSIVDFIASFLLGSIYIGMLNLKILLFLYVCAICILVLNHRFTVILQRNRTRLLDVQDKWIQRIQNFTYNFWVIKNYGKEDWLKKDLDLQNKKICDCQFQTNGLLNVLSMVNDGIGQWMFFGTILFGVVLIHLNQLKIGQLISIIQASNMVVMPITGVLSLKNRIDSSKGITKELLDEIKDESEEKLDYRIDSLKMIDLKNTSFSYGESIIFQNLTFQFEKNKRYLIIGESGCGKSTLLKVLMGILPCDSIYWNHLNSGLVNHKDFYKNVAYIGQNELMLKDTLKNNITLGEDCSDFKIKEILDEVCLSELKSRIYENMDNLAGEISGGQKQKISLARAIFFNRSWLILDETFASMDQDSEYRIENRLLEDKDLTLILVSHRISKEIYSKFDKVLLVKNEKLNDVSYMDYKNAKAYF